MNGVSKRVPGALADATEEELDAWTEQPHEEMGEDGRRTKRMRICGLEDDKEGAHDEEGEWATDDLSGEFIDASEVRAARKEETEFMKEIELCDDSTADEDCWKPAVSTKWVDSKKRGAVRSRLLARDFKAKGDKDMADLFASTPPLHVIKVVLVLARQDLGEDIVAVLVDVTKVHLNGRAKPEDGDHFITLPEEIGGGCAMLSALAVRHETCRARFGRGLLLPSGGSGKAAPTTFHNAATGTGFAVHGDDFTFVGSRNRLSANDAADDGLVLDQKWSKRRTREHRCWYGGSPTPSMSMQTPNSACLSWSTFVWRRSPTCSLRLPSKKTLAKTEVS